MTITASFKACYLPILATFMAKSDIRFYLNGFYIEPARGNDKGVYLAATDGHSLVVIHDESGEASASGIFPVPDVLLKHCGPVKRKLHKAVCAERRIVIANGFATSTLGQVAVEENVSAAIAPIEGKFPDLRRVLNADFDKMNGTAVVTLNAQYLARLKKIGKLQSNPVPTQIRAIDSHSTVYLLPQLMDHNIVVVIMPMKDDVRKRPEWLSNFLLTDDWLPMRTAPKGVSVTVLMADGTVHEDAHWACGGGEEQPPFKGWFISVKDAAGKSLMFSGIKDPVAWKQIEVKPQKAGPVDDTPSPYEQAATGAAYFYPLRDMGIAA